MYFKQSHSHVELSSIVVDYRILDEQIAFSISFIFYTFYFILCLFLKNFTFLLYDYESLSCLKSIESQVSIITHRYRERKCWIGKMCYFLPFKLQRNFFFIVNNQSSITHTLSLFLTITFCWVIKNIFFFSPHFNNLNSNLIFPIQVNSGRMIFS